MQFKGIESEGGESLTVTRISRYMERARPMTSKPGPGCVRREGTGPLLLENDLPMLAEEQGTPTCCQMSKEKESGTD